MIDRRILLGGAAGLLVAGGIGFGIARLTAPTSKEDHAEGEHEEEAGHEDEGFVALTAAEAAAAGVQVVAVGSGGGGEVILPGRVAFAPNAQASVAAPLAGRIVQVHVAAGSRVRAGTPLVTIRSGEGATARASVDVARANVQAARAQEARERRLLDAGVSARQDWEAARAASLKAQADLRAAEAQARALGSPNSSGVTVVPSPISGVVTRVTAVPGAVLEPGGEIAEVADPARVELVFDAPPANTALVAVGRSLEVRRPDGQVMFGTVTAVAPAVAGGGATIRAAPQGAPPPAGTVVSAGVLTGPGGGLAVPAEAVQTVEGVPSVFVLEARGFRVRSVVAGRTSAGQTEILRGLNGGERVAGKGAFLLKAELGKGDAEHGH